MQRLARILDQTKEMLPGGFYQRHAALYHQEHLEKMAATLFAYSTEGVPVSLPLPHFYAECTPAPAVAYAFFKEAMDVFHRKDEDENMVRAFAGSMEQAGISHLLVLLGQRVTPGSLQTELAIPPLKKVLYNAAAAPYQEGLTAAGREWTKHTQRSEDLFWGEIKGDNAFKNDRGMEFIERILEHASWWNVFVHFKHKRVYEARLPSGHGARWLGDGTGFIGFLEPFLEEQRRNEA